MAQAKSVQDFEQHIRRIMDTKQDDAEAAKNKQVEMDGSLASLKQIVHDVDKRLTAIGGTNIMDLREVEQRARQQVN